MHKRITSVEKRALREQLRREASESRPAFSETLHDRIISAIGRCRTEEATMLGGADIPVCRPGYHGEKRWPARAAAVAAACLLGAAVFGWQLSQRENVRPPVESSPPAVAAAATVANLSPIDELAGSTMENLDGLIASSSVVPQSAELAHDARLAAEALLRPLPVDMELFAGP
jgi:hypothetical protein